MWGLLGQLLAFLVPLVGSLKFDNQQTNFNLNQNRTATNPLDYWGEWQDHNFHPSPSNWRFPFYTLFLDRFVNGNPANDDANGTHFEHDVTGNQLRNGGDLVGLVDSLDYIQGMGIKGIYIAGTPFINFPWKSDGYSPLDLSLLDRHFGDIDTWRSAIYEIHDRGMYVILDNTMSTMGDLIGFDGFLNSSTPFSPKGLKVQYKTDRQYLDFEFRNNSKDHCEYPRFWNESGFRVLAKDDATFAQLDGCFDSEFDQYGDTEAFGVFPDWQRQLSKFASTQDRLREWVPSVREKIQQFSCITIAMLDIDGFRFDKATQVTVDAQAEYGEFIRQCARRVGKDNFFMPGEITGGNTFGSIYLGRGRQPDMLPENLTVAVTLTNDSPHKYFLRDKGKNALDAAAFHYSIYRSLTRFLGMDGNLTAGFDVPVNFVDTWNTMLSTNDLTNAFTGEFDPRHMYGVTNQDVFRWPAVKDGVKKMLLGLFVTTLHMPGVPLLLWGEEQAMYVLDNTADNYLFGRQPMSSTLAWQDHGCYRLGSSQYFEFPADAALNGCNDESVSLDHRDPTHPVRNIIKSMYHLRRNYPVLNDGYFLQSLSNQTHDIILPGSSGTVTETGVWSVMRDKFSNVQYLEGGNQSVWLVYQNDRKRIKYKFDCSSKKFALISPFDAGTVVKNLLAPYEEVKLETSPEKLGINFSEEFNGCLQELTLSPYGFKAYVPLDAWLPPLPMLTKFLPGHDARLRSKVLANETEAIDVELQFSGEMDCDSITQNLLLSSTTEDGSNAQLMQDSVSCSSFTDTDPQTFSAAVLSAWKWTAKVLVSNGVHSVTVPNVTSSDGRSTESTDRLLFRIGQADNPMVFPRQADYSENALSKDAVTRALQVSHKAAGADKFRYSLNWGSSWSDWFDYKVGGNVLAAQKWYGTKRQEWDGDHVTLQYWSRLTGSSNHIQHADDDWENKPPRRFPHIFAHGPFNEFGFDGGLHNSFKQASDGVWKFHLMTGWPSKFQVNVWGMNPDGQPDQTFVYGDIDNDTVIDRLPPDSLTQAVVNVSVLPPPPFLAYRMELNDGDYRFRLIPAGSRLNQIILFALLWVIPVMTGVVSIWTYMGAFYGVKFNKIGVFQRKNILPFFRRKFEKIPSTDDEHRKDHKMKQFFLRHKSSIIPMSSSSKRRTVLIATMEYDIEDWAVKIKIGGLGVMAQLMGKILEHQDLIWVVPCVGGVDYPTDTNAAPIAITILGKSYEIQVQYHQLKNITYVLLDAPVFRGQSKTEPYPPRMDDLDSAIYYSAWNACIAQTIKRFPVDIYHINDYHGAAAPLYLLPQTIPCCLSLHNAEFKALAYAHCSRTRRGLRGLQFGTFYCREVRAIRRSVQPSTCWCKLPTSASERFWRCRSLEEVRSTFLRPISNFWGLKEIGNLPNPDPTDTAPLDPEAENQPVVVDSAFEAARGDLRRQAQEWAHLDVNPDAELFVFVGRWSVQKGIDLIADVFPAVLDKHPNVQLICVGPVIDMYGKFAALKLGEMMKKYLGRVFSKPQFTTLPPYIFSGAEFALIPSRDEPFGLVAVEFGRKGALGVGARVGGLGQMPGWWFTVESTTTKHLQHQFISAIDDALGSKTDVRAMMRARSAKQRFPVAQWVKDLDILQSTSINIHQEEAGKNDRPLPRARSPSPRANRRQPDKPGNRSSGDLGRTLSLGVRTGPGCGRRIIAARDSTVALAGIDEEEDGAGYTGRFGEHVEVTITQEQAEAMAAHEYRRGYRPSIHLTPELDQIERGRSRSRALQQPTGSSPDLRFRSASPDVEDGLLELPRQHGRLSTGSAGDGELRRLSTSSVLSLNEVVGERHDYKLQKVDATFNDTTGEYYNAFEAMLQEHGADLSAGLCIGDYLARSEKAWFKKMRDARLGRLSRDASPNPSRGGSPYGSEDNLSVGEISQADEFLLGENYQRPSIVKRWLQTRIGDWPIYSLLLGLGQIMSVNSYQITLLTGGQGQAPEKVYIIGGIFMATSCIWWIAFRTLKSAYVLSLPWLFYGIAFFLVGIAPFLPLGRGRDWMRNVAVGLYTTASSSGSIFFALNFGDEGGAPIKSWVLRACLIQGTQQIYITALFYWGSNLITAASGTSKSTTSLDSKIVMPAITLPIFTICWIIGTVLFTSLPPYYHQCPGKTPYFYKALLRRKIIAWFFVTIVLQNYFLSTPYGRNWKYLWSSQYAPDWSVALLVFGFFVGVWAIILAIFGKLSNAHSWILPIFAIGLGAPRWCQMLWGTSSYGQWLPWMPGGPIAGALAGRALWLWLGVLDSIQGVGFGMMLLHTLTRLHIAVTLMAGQFLGSAVTLVAKATAPDKDGPGDVFPDFSARISEPLMKPWFWIALACQLAIPVGFFMVFRKAQLSKP